MISAKQKLRLIEYELAFMKKSLPRAVSEGKIGKDFADEKIETMEAIRKDYEKTVSMYEGDDDRVL